MRMFCVSRFRQWDEQRFPNEADGDDSDAIPA